MTTPRIRIGTRGSPLALAQAREVKARLLAAHGELSEGEIALEAIRTSGDRIQDRKLAEIGGKGLFTKEIEEALLAGTIDLAVHSMKDMPTVLPDGLGIRAVLPREDPRDGLISRHGAGLDELPPGAVVGSSSLRRQAQILARRSDLRIEPLRGNVETRLRKVAEGEVSATLLALAGLKRLGLADRVTAVLPVEVMLPAPAQGAIGIEARLGDERAARWLAPLDHAPSAACVVAERALLAALDGSCRTPIGALAEIAEDRLRLRAMIVQPDGTRMFQVEAGCAPTEGARLGYELGEGLRAEAGDDFFASLMP
ncbi:MAG: hydroxymethylbilane synthase [Alphaproteobacteria bacterium]|nr:hydroxymethylbilane synthase [Alphaproteobacteria bacterium]